MAKGLTRTALLVNRHALKDGIGWLMNDRERRLCSLTNFNQQRTRSGLRWRQDRCGTGQPVVRRMLCHNAIEAWETRQISGGRTRFQSTVTVNEWLVLVSRGVMVASPALGSLQTMAGPCVCLQLVSCWCRSMRLSCGALIRICSLSANQLHLLVHWQMHFEWIDCARHVSHTKDLFGLKECGSRPAEK